MLEPHLVKNDKGEMGIRLILDNFGVVQPLPPDAMKWDELTLRNYFNSVVPKMREELIAMRNAHQKKLRKKCATSSTGLSPSSEQKTPHLHLLPSLSIK